MKTLAPIVHVFLIIAASSCQISSVAIADVNARRAAENQSDQSNRQTNKNGSPAPIANSQSRQLFVISSWANLRDGQLVLENDFWGHQETAEEAKLYPNGTVEIDIMNCAGYLASGKTAYRRERGMRKVELIPESTAPDAAEKIKQCDSEPNPEITGSKVFGVAPSAPHRKNIKLAGVDLPKLSEALGKELANKKTTRGNGAARNRTKVALSVEKDNWTDLDGDGQIDLIEFRREPCASENDACTSLFRLVNGKWKNIADVQPL